MKSLPLPVILSLALAAAAHAQITTDGQRDAAYGPPLAVQLNPTGFGDNSNADPLAANGSELDVAHAVIRDGKLHILLTGNLETNFNKLNVFIDSRPAGQNTLANDNPDVDFNGLNNLAGLKFDNGFEADFFFTIGGGGDPIEFFANYAELGNPGVGTYLGGTGSPNAGFPVTLANGVQVGIDNSNTGGVTDSDASAAASVATGIEFSIPLALIGNPTAPVKVCALISNSNHDSLSNQVLGSLPAGYGNLASPSTVDFSNESNFPGPQFFTAPWQVTNTNDSGAGSLRQTIADAPAGSIITFDPSLSAQTITLGGTQLTIDKDLIIDASELSSGLTISGDGSSRVFRIPSSTTNYNVSLTGLTISDGSASDGGGIQNQGNLTMTECTIRDCTATNLGGGLHNNDGGITTLVRSTLSGNISNNDGGAIANTYLSPDTTLNLIHSTISENQSTDQGGGIWNSGTLIISSSTISGNTAGGFGGGVRSIGPSTDVTVENSVIAGNTAGSVANISGTIHTAGGVNFLSGEPLLAPLNDYGGPTHTMPPLLGSPVIDAAGVTDPGGTDQRCAPRFQNGALDIGAVEFQPAIVDTTEDQDDSPEGAELSLREAIAREFVSTITFDPALAGQTITLGGSAMTINKALTISGFDLHPGITLDANQASRVFHVSGTGSLTLQGLTITGGNGVGTPASGFGGAILTQGTLSASHCLFIGNSATLDGGAISGNCDLINCTFTENSAERNGSAVVMGNGSLHHCTVTNNQSNSSLFGAVYGFGGVVTISNCIVAENSPNDIWTQGGQIVFAGRNIAASTDSIVGPLSFTGPAPLTDSPALALLGNYGGPTLSRPPVPGSPAIDAALPATIQPIDDQRGAFRNPGVSDIGAVEYQGTSDLALFWNTDWDGDGNSFGVERALGNDPFTAGPDDEGNLTVPQFNPSGHATLSFRIGDDARADTIWILQRSTTLLPGSWQEIYRYDGPAFEETTQPDIAALWTTTITPNTTFAHVTDLNPPPGKAFYRFVAELVEP